MPGIPQPLVSPISLYSNAPVVTPATVTGATGEYGLFNIPVSNADGHSLVCYIGWNSVAFPTSPVASVADDAHNWWIPLVTTAAGFSVRGTIWIAPNARPASFVSISTALPTSNLTALVAELPTLPLLAVQGITPQIATAVLTGSQSVTAAAASPVYAFALAVTNNNNDPVTAPGSPWTPLGTVEVNDPAGIGGTADVAVTPMWGTFTAGTVSAAFSTSPSLVTMAVGMAAILQAPPAVVYRNPSWPALKVEAAFGYNPGDATVMPAWTDITSRVISTEGDASIDAARGRSYELTQPEPGDAAIMCDNHDGGLTPLNAASPYYPNVKLEVPVRVSATWNNRTYPVCRVNVDKWPQQWPDPQWGMSPMEGSDAMGILANLTMFSAYESEVLFDKPYAYWTCSESYAAANGLPFSNLALNNTKPLLGVDGQFSPSGTTPLATGQSLNMKGDGGTGIGITGLSSSPGLWSAGAFCLDAGLPQLSAGFTVEFWAVVDPAGTATPLVTLAGRDSNYPVNAGPVRFQATAINSSGNKTQVLLGDFQGNFHTDTGSAMPSDGLLHHHVFTVVFSGAAYTVTHYLDGALDHAFSTTGISALADVNEIIVGPAVQFPLGATPYNYAIGHVAVYTGLLNTQRIAAHYQAGGLGYANDTVFQRFKRIMAWGQSALPKAADSGSPSPLMGIADSLGGQDSGSALYDLMTSEGGAAYADAAGNVWYQSRISVYNRAPKYVFGDNPANGEIVYEPDASFDYDNAFLYNQVSGKREISAAVTIATDSTKGSLIQQFENDGAQVTVVDTSSETQYGRRNSLQQTVMTASDQDVYDRVNWSLAKYRQPTFRLPTLTLTPSGNTSIWPVALAVEQGDVVQVIRRPLGAPSYTVTGIVQKVEHHISPNEWQVKLAISPLNVELNVLKIGDPTYGTLAEGIGW